MNTNWTHTATLAATYPCGPEQFGHAVPAGETVTLWKDPTQQDGELITFRFGRDTGVAWISDLRNVEAK